MDWRLRAIFLAVASYVWYKYGEPIEITDLFRTRHEQTVIYGDDKAKYSPHEFWRAIDIVIRDFSPESYRELRKWINDNFPYQKERFTTCKYHDVVGWHLHIQVTSIGDMRKFFGRR